MPAPAADDEVVHRDNWRRWIGLAIAGAILAGGGAFILRPKINHYFEARALRLARAYLQQDDFRSAQLTLQGAVQVNPRDYEARRMLAELYASTSSLLEFSAWQDLVQMEPDNDLNQLGFAQCAVRTRNLAAAREALAAVSSAGRGTAAYFRAAAGLAMLAGDQGTLARTLGQLAQLEPGDERLQFNLAALQLAGPDPALAAAARARLIAWARGETWRIQATLELIRDLARRKNPREIPLLAGDILPRQAGLAGWTSRVLNRSEPPDIFELVEHMQQQAHPAAGDALALAGWMRTQGFAHEALLWLGTLNPVLTKSPQLLEERARCAVQIRDWRVLQELLRAGAWGSLSAEMLDLAFAARVQRENASLTGAEATWNDTLRLAGNSVPNLRARIRLAGAFGWPREMEKALWQLVRFAPTETWAWQALAAGAEYEESPDKLLLVLSSWAQLSPEDVVRADLVLLATLLQRMDVTTRATALELARLNPVPRAVLAAQALELWRLGRAAEAARLVEPFATDQSISPRVSLVCGIVLAEIGRKDIARQCLEAAGRVRFLPAEKALLEAARQKISLTARPAGLPPVAGSTASPRPPVLQAWVSASNTKRASATGDLPSLRLVGLLLFR